MRLLVLRKRTGDPKLAPSALLALAPVKERLRTAAGTCTYVLAMAMDPGRLRVRRESSRRRPREDLGSIMSIGKERFVAESGRSG